MKIDKTPEFLHFLYKAHNEENNKIEKGLFVVVINNVLHRMIDYKENVIKGNCSDDTDWCWSRGYSIFTSKNLTFHFNVDDELEEIDSENNPLVDDFYFLDTLYTTN